MLAFFIPAGPGEWRRVGTGKRQCGAAERGLGISDPGKYVAAQFQRDDAARWDAGSAEKACHAAAVIDGPSVHSGLGTYAADTGTDSTGHRRCV